MHGLRSLLKVSSQDLHCFHGTNLLNDNCINAYFRIIERRCFYYNAIPTVYAFDSFFFTAWCGGNHNKVKRWTRDVNIFARDILLFPLHVAGVGDVGHWALVVVWTNTHHITVYDSLGITHSERAADVLMYLQEEAKVRKVIFDKTEWLILETPPGTPKQHNKTDCGVYICAFAEILTRKAKLSSVEVKPQQLRRDLCAAVRRGRIDKEDFRLVEPPLTSRIRYEPMSTPTVKLRTYVNLGEKMEVILPSDPVVEAIHQELNRLSPSTRLTPRFHVPKRVKGDDGSTSRKQDVNPTLHLGQGKEDVQGIELRDEEKHNGDQGGTNDQERKVSGTEQKEQDNVEN